MIAAPLVMLVAVRPLLAEFPTLGRRRASNVQIADVLGPSAQVVRVGWALLAVVFIGGAAYSSFLALRDAPVDQPGHGAELHAFMPILRGKPVLYAGQDRYAPYELLGADTHVPLVEFPDPEVAENPEKPFDTGDAYSPIDFDSFSRGTLDRFPYVITGRAAWNSQAPSGFKRIAATPSFLLCKRTGETPENRHMLLAVPAAEPSFLQRLSGYDDVAYVGNLVAVRAGKRRIVPLSAACNSWIDWYESTASP